MSEMLSTKAPSPVFSMGLSTYKVPFSLHKTNRTKVINTLLEKKSTSTESTSIHENDIILLKGGISEERNDTDHEPIFRQESYFQYLFGVKEPDFWGMLDLSTKTCTLFCPRLPKEYAIWMGKLLTPEDFCTMYEVDEVLYVDQMEQHLETLLKSRNDAAHILLLEGQNSDSKNWYRPPTLQSPYLNTLTNSTHLFPILANARVIKSNEELSLLRHVTKVTSLAHTFVMQKITPQHSEFQLEALFRYYCYFFYGHRHVAYTPICACGPNAAVLHYGHAGAPNDVPLNEQKMCLLDMGSEYHCYGSDVTCSYPASGTFDEQQRIVYTAVLEAQKAVYQILQPGVSYVDCHKAAERAILTVLLEHEVLQNPYNDTIDAIVEKRLGAVFMPHGLGHLIGIDTHDVGGYLPGYPTRSIEPGLKSLRTARIMEPNMVVTVEPGCYFIPHLLDEAMNPENNMGLDHYFVQDKIDQFRNFGGVRLEDVVCITEDGCVNFTNCARTIEEVEHVMSGGKWPPMKDAAPELRRIYLTDPN